MKYLCGCDQMFKRGYILTTQPDGSQGYTRRDKEGYEVCPEHGDRLENWRAGIFDPRKLTGKTLGELDFSGPDTRDTRDPELVYAELKASSNGHSKSS